jgi:hypothetical protein
LRTHRSSAKTIAEFITYAKANPPAWPRSAAARTSHLAGELFKMTAGVDLVRAAAIFATFVPSALVYYSAAIANREVHYRIYEIHKLSLPVTAPCP